MKDRRIPTRKTRGSSAGPANLCRAFLVLLAFLLAACGSGTEENGASQPGRENLPESQYAPTENGGGLYVSAGRTLRYYDFAAGRTAALCSQVGCSHSDSSCPAYLGESETRCRFLPYGGKWYVLTDGPLTLTEIEPAAGKRRTLCVWPAGTAYSNAWASHGYLYVRTAIGETNQESAHIRLDRVHMDSGARELILLDRGTAAQLSAGLRGKVWEVRTTEEELPGVAAQGVVSSLIRRGSEVLVRLVAKKRPEDPAGRWSPTWRTSISAALGMVSGDGI